MKRITDPTFSYVPAARTNLAARFKKEWARIRKEQQEAKSVVTPIQRKASK